MNEVFKLREETHCQLRHITQFLVDPIHSVFNGSESALYLGPKIWEQIPTEIKNKDSLVGYKKEIKEMETLTLSLLNQQNFYSQFTLYLAFYFKINIQICIFFYFIIFCYELVFLLR